MPLYHFNVYDGRSDLDTEGSELANAGAARREGIRLTGAILDLEPDRFDDGKWRLEVTDHRGLILFELDISANTLLDAEHRLVDLGELATTKASKKPRRAARSHQERSS